MNDKKSKLGLWLRRGAAGLLSLMLVFSLIQPGLARADVVYICGKEAHTHSDACYEIKTQQKTVQVLKCSLAEAVSAASEEDAAPGYVHTHGERCYVGEELVCPLKEVEAHTHGAECYGKEPQCGQEEVAAHGHSDACQKELICTQEHEHTEECYTAKECTLEETAGHTHSAECGYNLICEKPEIVLHEHDENCYAPMAADGEDKEPKLTCTTPEVIAHVHDENCYEEKTEDVEVKSLICGLEEHTHTDACVQKPEEKKPAWTCGKEAHTHAEGCYDAGNVLICGLEEHTHTDACAAKVEEQKPVARETYEKTLEDLLTRAEALSKEAADYETQWEAILKETEALRETLASDCEAGNISLDEYYALTGKVDEIENIYFADMVPAEESSTFGLGNEAGDTHKFDEIQYIKVGNLNEGTSGLLINTQGVQINKTVPLAYRNVVLGYRNASSVVCNVKSADNYHVTIDGEQTSLFVGENETHYVGRSDGHLVRAGSADAYKILAEKKNPTNPYSVTYNNIATDAKGNQIDLKLVLVDYAISDDYDEAKTDRTSWETVQLGFFSGGKPGISSYRVEWLEVRYEFWSNGRPLNGVKGNTSYYDVDGKQGVLLTDKNEGIIARKDTTNGKIDFPTYDSNEKAAGKNHMDTGTHNCELGYTTIDNQPYVYQMTSNTCVSEDACVAFTEYFDTGSNSNSFTRIFRFQGGGIIGNSAQNVIPLGRLVVTKNVVGAYDNNDSFAFTVTLKDAQGNVKTDFNGNFGSVTFTDGVTTFNLKNGESKTIDYIDTGVFYAVEETQNDKYTLTESTGATGQFTNGTTAQATFTNTRKTTGSVEVTKNVTGIVDDTEFTFTATLKDGTTVIPFPAQAEGSGVTVNNDGMATFKLTGKEGGNQITLTGLSVGATLEISEVTQNGSDVTPEGKYQVTDKTLKWVVEENTKKEMTFTNTRKTGTLTIKKSLVGTAIPDTNKTFSFDVFWTDAAADAEGVTDYGEKKEAVMATAAENGAATVREIPYGAKVKVVETTTDGYTVTSTTGNTEGNSSLAFEFTPDADGNQEVTFTNTQKGKLSITKRVEDTNNKLPADFKPDYTINVKIGDNALAVDTPYTVTSGTGESAETEPKTVETAGEIKLKDGQTAVIDKLPMGAAYSVTEADDSRVGFKVKGEVKPATTTANKVIGEDTQVTIENQVVEVHTPVYVSKTLRNHDKSAEGHTYYFALYQKLNDAVIPVSGVQPVAVTVKGNGDSAKANFTLNYDTSDLVVDGAMLDSRTFDYVIYEMTAAENGQKVTNTETGALADAFAITKEQEIKVILTGTKDGIAAKAYFGDTEVTEEKPANFDNILLEDLTIVKEMADEAYKDVTDTFLVDVVIESEHFQNGMTVKVNGTEKAAIANGAKSVTLTGISIGKNQNAVISGIPHGSTYTITETNGYGYQSEVVKGTVDGNEAIVTNKEMTDDTVKITFTKKLNNPDKKKHTFNFALTEVDKDGKAVTDGKRLTKAVDIKGESAEFSFDALTYKTSDLAGGTVDGNAKVKTFYYLVTEATQDDWKTLDADETEFIVEVTLTGKQGELKAEITDILENDVSKGADYPIEFRNTLLGSLTVKKSVVGGGNPSDSFKFRLKLDKAHDGTYLAEQNDVDTTLTIKNGLAEFWLRRNEEITIYGLPHGLEVEVYEFDAEEYRAYHKIDTSLTRKGQTANVQVSTDGTTVKYINYDIDSEWLPQTGQLKWPILVLAALGIGLLGFGALTRKRKRNGK